MAEKCPHCGYCPHCGRANTATYPYYPRPNPYPYWTWAATGTNTGQITTGAPSTVTFKEGYRAP